VQRYVVLGLANLRDALDVAICRATGLGMPRVPGTWVLREEDAFQIVRYAGIGTKKWAERRPAGPYGSVLPDRRTQPDRRGNQRTVGWRDSRASIMEVAIISMALISIKRRAIKVTPQAQAVRIWSPFFIFTSKARTKDDGLCVLYRAMLPSRRWSTQNRRRFFRTVRPLVAELRSCERMLASAPGAARGGRRDLPPPLIATDVLLSSVWLARRPLFEFSEPPEPADYPQRCAAPAPFTRPAARSATCPLPRNLQRTAPPADTCKDHDTGVSSTCSACRKPRSISR
jgi:hypothetical protein